MTPLSPSMPDRNGKRATLLAVLAVVVLTVLRFSVLLPYPVVLQFVTRGRVAGYSLGALLLALCVGFFCLAQQSEPEDLLQYGVLLPFAVLSLVMGEVAMRHSRFERRMLYSSLGGVIALVLVWVAFVVVSPVSPDEFVKVYLHKLLAAEAGAVGALQDDFQAVLFKCYPALLLLNIFLVVWLNFFILLKRHPSAFASEDIAHAELPEGFLVLLVGTLVLICLGYLIEHPQLERLSFNLAIVVGAIYFFQGLAVCAFYINKFKGMLFIKPVLYLLIFMQLPMFVSLLGIFDYWFDFRGLKKLTTSNPSSHKESS